MTDSATPLSTSSPVDLVERGEQVMLTDLGPAVPGTDDNREMAILRLCRVFTAATIKAGNSRTPALSAPQVRTLTMLAATEGGMSLNSVAQCLGTTASAASRVCSRLVRDGLVNRGDGPGNEIRLTLSEQGIALLGEVNRERLAHIRPLFDDLAPDEQDRVYAVIERLAAAITVVGGPW